MRSASIALAIALQLASCARNGQSVAPDSRTSAPPRPPAEAPPLNRPAAEFCFGDEAIIVMLGQEGPIGGTTENNRFIINEGPLRGYSSNLNGLVPFRPGTIVSIEVPGGMKLGNREFDEGTIVRLTSDGIYEQAPEGTEICVRHNVAVLGEQYPAGSRLVVAGTDSQKLIPQH